MNEGDVNAIWIYNARLEADSSLGGLQKSGFLCHIQGRSCRKMWTTWTWGEGHACMQEDGPHCPAQGKVYLILKLASVDSYINLFTFLECVNVCVFFNNAIDLEHQWGGVPYSGQCPWYLAVKKELVIFPEEFKKINRLEATPMGWLRSKEEERMKEASIHSSFKRLGLRGNKGDIHSKNVQVYILLLAYKDD